MDLTRSTGSQYHRGILDAMPYPMIILEEGGRIVDSNTAARLFINAENRKEGLRPGDVLGCIHAREKGCGASGVCGGCPINTAVNRALEEESPSRQVLKLIVAGEEGMRELEYIVTLSPLRLENLRLALMILEDPREIVSLRQTLPVCSHCKQVRGKENDWQSIENYLSSRLEIHCTHSLCPECARKFFPEYASALENETRD